MVTINYHFVLGCRKTNLKTNTYKWLGLGLGFNGLGLRLNGPRVLVGTARKAWVFLDLGRGPFFHRERRPKPSELQSTPSYHFTLRSTYENEHRDEGKRYTVKWRSWLDFGLKHHGLSGLGFSVSLCFTETKERERRSTTMVVVLSCFLECGYLGVWVGVSPGSREE